MAVLLARRLAASGVLLLLLLTLLFFLLHLAPGEPGAILLDPRVPRAQAEALRHIFRLDEPLGRQYLAWVGAFLRGEWGVSFVHQRPVRAVLAEAVPATLLLASAALVGQYGLGLLLGIAGARRAGRWTDHLLRVASLTLYSIPVFWLGLMALLVFSEHWGWFPAGQMTSVGADRLGAGRRVLDLLHHLALPALVLSLPGAGGIARFVRNALLEELSSDYVRAARARGVGERRVVWLHALRNGAAPLVHLAGVDLSLLLSGALIVEVVFSWPGMGGIAWESIRSQDVPVVLAATALSGSLVIVGNLLADLAHAYLDPRLRHAP